jgi:hypothetical protein
MATRTNIPGVREIDEKIQTLQSARAILSADSGNRGGGSMSASGRGGARPGAGRPKGTTSTRGSRGGKGRGTNGNGNE